MVILRTTYVEGMQKKSEKAGKCVVSDTCVTLTLSIGYKALMTWKRS